MVGKSKLENHNPIASMEDTKSCGEVVRKKFSLTIRFFGTRFYYSQNKTVKMLS